MQTPVQVTFHRIEPSDFIETYARGRAAKLDTFHARITACRVSVEAPHQHQKGGRHFRVCIDVTVPGGEVVVSHAPDESAANEDVYAAIDEAFDRLGRRLQDHVRRQRGDVKSREESYREGRVTKLWSYEGYGFLEAEDGGEFYFHRNSVLHHVFDRMKVGSFVRFVEELGEKGPQASTVILVGAEARSPA